MRFAVLLPLCALTRHDRSFCSVATSVTVLNALSSQGVLAPTAAIYAPFAYFTQTNLWNYSCVRSVATHSGAVLDSRFVASNGATLDECVSPWLCFLVGPCSPSLSFSLVFLLKKSLSPTLRRWAGYVGCFAAAVATHASASSVSAFRSALSSAFSAVPPTFVAVNFLRTGLGEVGGGHMSPIGAYEPASDRVLLLDVARYKYGPHWVTAASLFAAMNTVDSASGVSRGWISVSTPVGPKSLPSGPPPPLPVPFASAGACVATLPTDNTFGVEECFSTGVAPPAGCFASDASSSAAPAAAPQSAPVPVPACAPSPPAAPPTLSECKSSSAAGAWVLFALVLVGCGYLVYLLYMEKKAHVQTKAQLRSSLSPTSEMIEVLPK